MCVFFDVMSAFWSDELKSGKYNFWIRDKKSFLSGGFKNFFDIMAALWIEEIEVRQVQNLNLGFYKNLSKIEELNNFFDEKTAF